MVACILDNLRRNYIVAILNKEVQINSFQNVFKTISKHPLGLLRGYLLYPGFVFAIINIIINNKWLLGT
jgi:hypothetical protein